MAERMWNVRPRWLASTAAAALALGLLAACAAADADPDTELLADSFVADLDGNVFVGVMVAEHPDGQTRDVVVYLCDEADVSTWLYGQTTGGSIVLEGDGVSVALTLGATVVTGEVEFAGQDPQSFSAVAAEGDAGLHRAEGETVEGLRYVGGWIILNTLEQRGALTLDGEIHEHPTLDPATGEAETSFGTLSTEQCFRNPWTGEKICRRL